MENKTKKKNNRQFIQIGFLLILFGVLLMGYEFGYKHKIRAQQLMNQKIYEDRKEKLEKQKKEQELVKEDTNSTEQIDSVKVDNKTESKKEPNTNSLAYQYIGMLTIPKINLKQGFVSKNNIHNNVEENVTILPASNYPDEPKGNFILAAHSGNGAIAYFNELYHLQERDKIYVEYKNKNYTYEIVKIYKQEKTGTIRIYRNPQKSTITLITCTNYDNTSQTVYIGELISTT